MYHSLQMLKTSPRPPVTASQPRVSLADLALVFLKLGTIAFGGPAAHIAMMEDEFVRTRQWLTRSDFLDRLAAANLIPGPSSTELAIFIGQEKRGWLGLIVAGSCFILPAAIIVSFIAAAYVRFGSLPQMSGILYGIKPAVIAIILQALWNLGQTAAKTRLLIVIGVAAAALNLLGLSPLLVLVFAALTSAVTALQKPASGARTSLAWLFPSSLLTGGAGLAAPFSLAGLFTAFLKIGAIVFGSGYVLLAFLRTEFVERLHWLTERQLIDAVAVGQFTPGPVFTTATFIGYVLGRGRGAAVATLGIFLPGFLLVAASGPLIRNIRRSPLAGSMLDGVVAGSLALMAVVSWQLAKVVIVDWVTATVLLVSLVLLLRFRVNSAWLIAAGALVGWVARI
ncbi:MAG TPA: chromate efflux transporter [Terriglobales bacterium]|nr:chromate efflux transporter [Terriglobales bacterium]